MGRQLVAQVAGPGAAALGHLLPELDELLDQAVDLLLLSVYRQIQLIQQVFGETGLDFQILDAARERLGVFHGPIGQEGLIRQHPAASYTRRLMRRWLCVLLLALLPLQFSWAAVAGYCAHESQPQVRHLGHHSHEHAKASADAGDDVAAASAHAGDEGPASASGHADCSQCHGLGVGAPVPVPVVPAMVEVDEPVPAATGGRLLRIATPLDRPRWLPLA